MGIRETKKDNSELFKWDGKPSAGQVFPLAAQHVLAAVVGCVTPAILVANAANNAGGNVDMGLLIQMSLVFAALSTLLQLYGNKIRIGSASGDHRREFCLRSDDDGNRRTGKSIDTILGAMLIGGVIAIIVGLTIKQIRKVFPPLVIGTVIFAIGLSLYKTAINYMAGNPANTYELVVEQQGKTPALVFGSWQNWVVAFVTLAIVVALNHYGKGLFKLASILIGLLCGYVLALCFGMVDFSVLSSAGWFQIPKPMEFGMKFEISAIIPLAILFLVNSIQAMGDFSATTSGGMDRLPTDRELNGGIIGYGIGNIISAFFGCPPTATFSQNVGIVGTTKVISRRVFATSAGILLVAGLIPKFSALLRTIPQCVLGGAVVSVFASIAMTGIRLLVTEKLTARNATVAGLSIAIGMGVSLSGGCLDQMTQSIHSALNLSMNLENFQAIINNTFASSPVVLATIFAVILNLILPKEKTTEKETKLR
ncbi:MAG: uracil-xanthine permease family protein [[Ruminococcus] torques]|uniref:uracil-xanthine permease family protein n=1 Tax=[Ruminococcus] torques TaxID=33039 RepID=UPI0039911FD7